MLLLNRKIEIRYLLKRFSFYLWGNYDLYRLVENFKFFLIFLIMVRKIFLVFFRIISSKIFVIKRI